MKKYLLIILSVVLSLCFLINNSCSMNGVESSIAGTWVVDSVWLVDKNDYFTDVKSSGSLTIDYSDNYNLKIDFIKPENTIMDFSKPPFNTTEIQEIKIKLREKGKIFGKYEGIDMGSYGKLTFDPNHGKKWNINYSYYYNTNYYKYFLALDIPITYSKGNSIGFTIYFYKN